MEEHHELEYEVLLRQADEPEDGVVALRPDGAGENCLVVVDPAPTPPVRAVYPPPLCSAPERGLGRVQGGPLGPRSGRVEGLPGRGRGPVGRGRSRGLFSDHR